MPFGPATILTTLGKNLTASQVAGTTLTPPKYIAIGTGATAAARTALFSDTVLSTEIGTRMTGTATATADTFQTVGTYTATGAVALDEAGLFTASTSGSMAVSSTFPVISLANGDSIQITAKIQYT